MHLYYQKNGRNFGDVLSENIFGDLFDQDVRYAKYFQADYIAIGSILQKVFYNDKRGCGAYENLKKKVRAFASRNRPLHVLGSGFIEDVLTYSDPIKPVRKLNLIALRGEKTRDIMSRVLGEDLSQVPLGDAGLLVSELFEASAIKKKFALGVVPHFIDQEAPGVRSLLAMPGACLLDVLRDPQDFLQDMAACQTVVSTSLHGLIAADSLHIPNLWIEASDNVDGSGFKFQDYYSIYGLSPNSYDLRIQPPESITPERIRQMYQVDSARVEQVKSQLMDVFSTHFNQSAAHGK